MPACPTCKTTTGSHRHGCPNYEKRIISEATYEKLADARIQALLKHSSAYRNAANAEEQADVEGRIEERVIDAMDREYQIRELIYPA